MCIYTAKFGMIYTICRLLRLLYTFARKIIDNLDGPNFAYCKSFPTVAIN